MAKYLPSLRTFLMVIVVMVLDQLLGLSWALLSVLNRFLPAGMFPLIKLSK